MIPNDNFLLQILSRARERTVVYVSEDLHIGFINHRMPEIWKKEESIVGKRLIDAAPELAEFIPFQHDV